MKAQCEAAVRAAAGAAKLTKADLDGIESRIIGAMKTLRRSDPSAWARMDTAARMNAAAKLARERYVESVARGAARLADRLSKKARNDAAIAAVKPGKNGRLAALDRSLFYEGAERGGTTSLEKDIQATIAMFWRKLEGEHSLVMQAPDKQAAIYDELFGKDSGDPQAKAAAKAVRAAMDEMFEAAQHAGIADNPLENWTLPQKRDWTRMGNRETWMKKQMERLDLSEFVEPDGSQMSPERIRETLEESFATLATNGANKLDGQGGKGKLGVRGPRQLHYKDGASLKAEMDDYGYGSNLKEIVRSHIRSVARDLAIAEREGYMADTDVAERAAAAHAADLAAVTSAHDKRTIEKTYTKFKRNWQVLRRGSVPGNARWANAMRLVRSVMSSTMLGASNALPDVGMAKVHLGAIGLQTDHLLRDIMAGMKPTKANRFRIGQAGIFMEGLHDAAQRFGEDTFAPTARAANFLNHGVYVGSSLRMWDRGEANGAACAVMRTLGEHLHKMPDDFEKLDEPSLDYLRRKGVTQELWQTWRLAELDKGPDGNAPMLTPDSIAEIPDEKLEPLAEQRVAQRSAALKERIANMQESSTRHSEWLTKRIAKFTEAKAKAESALAELKAKVAVRAGHREGVNAARAEMLRAQIERAEVETDISRYLATETHQGRMLDFLDAVESGAERERAVIRQRVHPDYKSDAVIENFSSTPGVNEKIVGTAQRFASDVGAKGEQLGARRAAIEARIAAAEKAAKEAEKEAGAAVDEREAAMNARLQARFKELTEFASKTREANGRRADFIRAHQKVMQGFLPQEMNALRRDAQVKLLSSIYTDMQAAGRGFSGMSIRDQVDQGYDRLEAGTFMGELIRTLVMIRQVPIGIFKTHMLDVPKRFDSRSASWMYRAKFLAATTLLGGLGVQLKNIAFGADPDNMTDGKFWAKALMASGGLGLYGDALFSPTNGEHAEGIATKIAGPLGTATDDFTKIFRQAQNDPSQFGNPTWQLGLLRFVRNNATPFMRLWYVRAAFDHLVYQQMQEMLNPGYNERVRHRMLHPGGDQAPRPTWWSPGETQPERAPDLGAAVGQPTQ